ncbi:synaptonemal complex central element protein 1 isoform X2 [Halichoeres trimaculatus]|uniref:synaptonemal complex central element protein 1 isoform X2 n=1 Tax=Halichoeres trimaculatus TaxID=147232 RepID=UPI003D9FA66A
MGDSAGKRFLEEEIKEMQSLSDSLQKELATLQTEAYKLEGIRKEKEELSRKLQLQCDQSKQDFARQSEYNSKELLEQYKCETQEIRLKQRKQRMKFENQLHLLMEQHKNLHSVFAPDRLPDEIRSAENTNSQLLLAAEKKCAYLNSLHKEIEEVKKQKQQGTTPALTNVE